ncbi:MAG: DUF120 domain-containing protein [Candidatus Micrarchaeota archaeon]
MDEVLILLLRKEAHIRPAMLTTTEVGKLTGMSQQNASRKLAALEEAGHIQRSKEGIMLTSKACDELGELYSSLKKAFGDRRLEIEGVISKGLGEGGYYVSLEGYQSQMKEKLGFRPYPGTLNINIGEAQRWKRQHLLQGEPIVITGFKGKERSYGDLFAYKCAMDGEPCAIIIPLRTHHGADTLELICPFNVKKRLGKGEGDRVKVIV